MSSKKRVRFEENNPRPSKQQRVEEFEILKTSMNFGFVDEKQLCGRFWEPMTEGCSIHYNYSRKLNLFKRWIKVYDKNGDFVEQKELGSTLSLEELATKENLPMGEPFSAFLIEDHDTKLNTLHLIKIILNRLERITREEKQVEKISAPFKKLLQLCREGVEGALGSVIKGCSGSLSGLSVQGKVREARDAEIDKWYSSGSKPVPLSPEEEKNIPSWKNFKLKLSETAEDQSAQDYDLKVPLQLLTLSKILPCDACDDIDKLWEYLNDPELTIHTLRHYKDVKHFGSEDTKDYTMAFWLNNGYSQRILSVDPIHRQVLIHEKYKDGTLRVDEILFTPNCGNGDNCNERQGWDAEDHECDEHEHAFDLLPPLLANVEF